jgi:uncharacterized protein
MCWRPSGAWACCRSTPSVSSRAARTSCCSAGSARTTCAGSTNCSQEGALFEYWAHEASSCPLRTTGSFRHRMLEPERMGWKYRAEWVAEHRDNWSACWSGCASAARCGLPTSHGRTMAPAGWWEWKPEKRALEACSRPAELMVARRQAFQRVYDLRERVHAGRGPTNCCRASRNGAPARAALGACAGHHDGGLGRGLLPHAASRPHRHVVHGLAHEGELMAVQVDGWDDVAYMHPAHRRDRAPRGTDGALTRR